MRSLLPMLAAAALALAVPAQADPRQNPTADYTADSVSTTDGEPDSVSKIWYTKDKIRADVTQQGETMTVILDRPAKKMTVLLPKTKQFQTEPLPADDATNPLASGTWEVAKAGEETVAGVAATKWSVNGKGADGRAFKGFVWTTKDNIQVKMEGEAEEDGKTLKVASALKNLKIGPVDAKVFEIPKDYKPMPKE